MISASQKICRIHVAIRRPAQGRFSKNMHVSLHVYTVPDESTGSWNDDYLCQDVYLQLPYTGNVLCEWQAYI